jgi:hypothetical protein
VKLRSCRGVETLKFKHLVEEDERLQLQLWLEKAEDDYAFPLAQTAVNEFSRTLGFDLPTQGSIAKISELLRLIRTMTTDVQIVAVEKTRRSFVWVSENSAVLIDVADISSPRHTLTIGLEDLTGINEFSSRHEVMAARDAVSAARDAMGLPGDLKTSSYLEALTKWVGN